MWQKIGKLLFVVLMFIVVNKLSGFLFWALPSPLDALLNLHDMYASGGSGIILETILYKLLLYQVSYYIISFIIAYVFRSFWFLFFSFLILMQYLLIPIVVRGASISSIVMWNEISCYLMASLSGGLLGIYIKHVKKRS